MCFAKMSKHEWLGKKKKKKIHPNPRHFKQAAMNLDIYPYRV